MGRTSKSLIGEHPEALSILLTVSAVQDNLQLTVDKEKLLQDLDPLRVPGLLRRDEIAKVSESNSERQPEATCSPT